jgi:molybdopterin-synthase adenylyltransferase
MTNPLSPPEIERYARHIVLSEIGGPGQQKLKAARVLMIGAGAVRLNCFGVSGSGL